MRPTLYILCGIPYSGKTYFSKHFIPNSIPIALNDVRGGIWSDDQSSFDIFAHDIAVNLADEENVIADALNLTPGLRHKLTDAIDKYYKNYKIVYVVFGTALQKCLERNGQRIPDKIIKEMFDSFVPPISDAYELEDARASGVWWINGEI